MLLKYIFYGILIYLLFKFIFDLVIPVSKATSQVKDKLREMQEAQEAQQQQQRRYQQQTAQTQQTDNQPKGGDYIDFEEIK